MTKFVLIFIGLNLVNVGIQTLKTIITINGNKWVASAVNAITYFVYTYVIIYTNMGSLTTFEKAIIVALCNLFGVWVVKFIFEKTQKDKLWLYQCTCKVKHEQVEKIFKSLKDLGINSIYNEIVPNQLYSLQVFSYTQKESAMIKSILKNYNIKYCAIETKVVGE